MARVLDAFPELSTQRHPWSEWLDGQPRELVRGQASTQSPAPSLLPPGYRRRNVAVGFGPGLLMRVAVSL
jgi:hypothetical protein